MSNYRLPTNSNNGDVSSPIDGDAITKIATVSLNDSTTTGTTTFTNQNPTQILGVKSDLPHTREVVQSSTTGALDQGIASFMAKPIIINSGSITSANLANSLLFRFAIAPQLTAKPLWANKIAGFMNIRGTARVRLQVNANPFQAGRLILAYIPQYEHMPNSGALHQASLMAKTQLPHVEMSLQDTECELEIPYIAPTTHYNVRTGFYDWGTVFCWIYSPLTTGTSGTNQVTYSAWLSFDDFELETPIVAQSGMSMINKKNVIKKYRVNGRSLDSEVNEGKGPISSVLSGVSSIASGLYSIPFLSPIAGPTAWVTNIMSGVASSFGWSKPILDTAPCRMFSNPHAYLANTNASDITNNLSLLADNKVTIMPDVNLSGVDEMSINFVKRQKAFYKSVIWTTSTLPGPLARDVMLPTTFRLDFASIPFGATSDVNPSDYTPVAFLGKLYKQWRGSFEVTIKIVKTQYHTGRLIVAFAPATTSASITNIQTDYVHREVIDLRDGDEFCISVPYCNNTMYSDCVRVQANEPFMMLHVNVLNELVAPETAGQSVELLFEIRGGEDLEYQVPNSINMVPALTIVPQSGGDSTVPPILCNSIGGSTIHDPSTQASQLCIGEHSSSLLQLMKRYTKLCSTLNIIGGSLLRIYPYAWGGYFANGVPLGGTSATFVNDYLSLFAGCFAHSRGGVRYRLIQVPVSESDTTTGSIISMLVPFDALTNSPVSLSVASANDQLGMGTPAIASEGVINNGVTSFDQSYAAGTAVSVPMYSKTFARLNHVIPSNSVGAFTPSSNGPDICTSTLQFTTTEAAFNAHTSIYRCASDDFHMSFWLGVPTLSWLNP